MYDNFNYFADHTESMANKETRSVAMRMNESLFNRMQQIIDQSGLFYTKQEFTIFAVRKTYCNLFYDLGITSETSEIDYRKISESLRTMTLCKSEYERYKGDRQFIIKVADDLYDNILFMCQLLGITMQDFIKGSIVFELKTLELFIQDRHRFQEIVSGDGMISFKNNLNAAGEFSINRQ